MPTSDDAPSPPSFIERVTGKRTKDINLPAPESARDPRLKGFAPGSVRDALGKAVGGVKILQQKGLLGNRSPGGKR